MRTCLQYCYLLLVIPAFVATEFRTDYQFNDKVDGWLKFHIIPATWNDARLRCQLEGAELASPTNREMLKAMVDMMKNKQRPNTPRAIYTGVHATYSKGDYFTLKGVPLSKLNLEWAPNEPDNRVNTENCLILNPSDATISDVSCERVYPYMCYKKRTDNMPPMSICGTTDPAYRFDNRTGSCYKYHHRIRTWARAFETCAAEGGYLAIPNSAEEIQIYKELHPKIERGPYRTHTIVFLGFRWVEDWVTIDGQTLEEAGYAEWISSEPNNIPTHSDYVELCGSYRICCDEPGFHNWKCELAEPFICEMTPTRMT